MNVLIAFEDVSPLGVTVHWYAQQRHVPVLLQYSGMHSNVMCLSCYNSVMFLSCCKLSQVVTEDCANITCSFKPGKHNEHQTVVLKCNGETEVEHTDAALK